MRTIFVLFDSLNRLALGAYGGTAIATPNFDRFSKRAVTFDNHYVGSLPCMPARRDLHTGRLNFMHRSWGPLEPFDNSFPETLKNAGIYSHLVTDHSHYFEDGGATYHNRYSTWDFIRGQENDAWKAMVEPPLDRLRQIYADKHYNFDPASGFFDHGRLQHAVNKTHMEAEEDFPGPRCFASGLEFLETNHQADNWFLQIECFDPHEPFDAPERFKGPYRTGWNGGILNWPHYEKVVDSPEEIAEIRANYAALVAMCDHYFGRLLDYMDAQDMWGDTALVLSTDHGFLLSEHEWWGKNLQPYYREIAHIPLVVHHPEFADRAGERARALTQTFDLMPTFLDTFGLVPPPEARGTSVLQYLRNPQHRAREIGIFGMFGGPIGATDGRYTYYLYPEDLYAPGLHEYTLMPTHIRSRMSVAELHTARLTSDFSFTKGAPVMRIDALKSADRVPNIDGKTFENLGTQLFDLEADPNQENPFRDRAFEERMKQGIVSVLKDHECPEELYDRLGLEGTGPDSG